MQTKLKILKKRVEEPIEEPTKEQKINERILTSERDKGLPRQNKWVLKKKK